MTRFPPLLPVHRHQRGLTLIELMIALTLGLIVIGAVIAIFVSTSQNYRQNDALATLQDNARYALDVLGRDVAMSGYWGGVQMASAGINIRLSAAAGSAVSNSATPGDCGPATPPAGRAWLFDSGVPLVFRDQTDPNPVATSFRCLDHVAANTDVVLVRRASGQVALDIPAAPTGNFTLPANRFYLKTNGNIASLIRAMGNQTTADPSDCPDSSGANAPCPPVSTPVQYYAYTPHLYYVRDYRSTVGDGETALCRRFLDDTGATAQMNEECLADGVENLQIEWGIDNQNNDGVPDYYTATPSLTEMEQAVTARIHVLVRAPVRNVTLSQDTKIYKFANYLSSSDTSFVSRGYIRKLYSTTVQLKNARV